MKFDTRDGARYEQFTRRAAILSLGSLGVFGALASRMYYLQVIEGEQYQTMAEDNRINRRLLTPLRGRILDRFGVELASNTQNFQVLLIAEDTDDLDGTLDAISKIVPLSEARRKRITREVRRKRKFVPVTIAENLSWEQFAQINIQAPNLPGILADVGDVRNYPYKDRLAHVIGYVAKATDRDVEENDDPLYSSLDFALVRAA